jgi:glycosyltransferase involved in cell wall biosynthesis
MDISVVVNTYNEADKLGDCLESVKDWVSEIVVVDMGSTDKTLDIARRFRAKIFNHPHLSYVEPARNFALNKAQGDWVLVLDPDERIPVKLAGRLQKVVKEDIYEAVNIARKNIIFGKWIKHSNWWPDKHVRFFKRGSVSWNKEIHLYPKVKGLVLNLPNDPQLAIEHLNYENVNQFLERQNRYTDVSAHNRYLKGERFSWLNFFWNPSRLFLQRYFRHAGFLDGFWGLSLALLTVYSQIGEEIKLWEKENIRSS